MEILIILILLNLQADNTFRPQEYHSLIQREVLNVPQPNFEDFEVRLEKTFVKYADDSLWKEPQKIIHYDSIGRVISWQEKRGMHYGDINNEYQYLPNQILITKKRGDKLSVDTVLLEEADNQLLAIINDNYSDLNKVLLFFNSRGQLIKKEEEYSSRMNYYKTVTNWQYNSDGLIVSRELEGEYKHILNHRKKPRKQFSKINYIYDEFGQVISEVYSTKSGAYGSKIYLSNNSEIVTTIDDSPVWGTYENFLEPTTYKVRNEIIDRIDLFTIEKLVFENNVLVKSNRFEYEFYD